MVDISIGMVGLERLKKTAQSPQVLFNVPSLQSLVPFLDISPYQEYVVSRIKGINYDVIKYCVKSRTSVEWECIILERNNFQGWFHAMLMTEQLHDELHYDHTIFNLFRYKF